MPSRSFYSFPIILLVWKVKNDLNDFWWICQNKFSSIFRSINCFIFDKMFYFLFFMYIEFTFLNWLKQWFSVNVFNAINTHRNTHKIITNFKHLWLGQPVRQFDNRSPVLFTTTKYAFSLRIFFLNNDNDNMHRCKNILGLLSCKTFLIFSWKTKSTCWIFRVFSLPRLPVWTK